jgi:hypothetical protein
MLTALLQVMKSVQTPYQRLRLGDCNLLVAIDKNTQVRLQHATAAAAASETKARHSSSIILGVCDDDGLAPCLLLCHAHMRHLRSSSVIGNQELLQGWVSTRPYPIKDAPVI